MGANIGWLFYKDYFKDIDYSNLSSNENKNIINNKVKNIIDTTVRQYNEEPLGNIHFKATTTYPGLLLGSGYAHELSSIEGQAILGFDFDYTTGLPIIRGSSIKGVLRSAFKYEDYIKELLGNQSLNISKLEKEIFDNSDIFFDATIVSSGKILADDYLAPHGDNELKNPTPLRFIKVAPNVTFRFDFELSDGVIDKNEKTLLFASILADLGVGAKTNVGYGKFPSDLKDRVKREIEEEKERQNRLKEEQKEQAKQEKLEQELNSIESNVEKIKFITKDMTKNDTKTIHEKIKDFNLSKDEKSELINYFKSLIGEKPKPKNKASIKWAIKIYEFLES
jgi:CRISPR-associated protein Cmr6